MKKVLSSILALLLCSALLSGCTGPESAMENIIKLPSAVETALEAAKYVLDETPFEPKDRTAQAGTARAQGVAFDDMEYLRPDIDAMAEAVYAVEDALAGWETQARVEELLDECCAQYDSFMTMYALANIRCCQNLNDEYYADEYGWCSREMTTVSDLLNELYFICAQSRMAEMLERDYFWDGFVDQYSGYVETVDEAAEDTENQQQGLNSMELQRRESELISQYRALVSSATLELDGRTMRLDELVDVDADTYNRGMSAYYEQNNSAFAEIYIEMVEVRKALAADQGYDSFEQMQYDSAYVRDFTPEQAEEYTDEIKRYIAPIYKKATADGLYQNVDRNELPEELLMDMVRSVTESMGGTAEEAFRFMEERGLYDVKKSDDKLNNSFQTYIKNYESPFLFVDPYGTIDDLMTLAHEFGHYLDAYVDYDAEESIDVAECYSQGMEYLILSRVGDYMDESELEQLETMKLLDTLELYAVQASYNQFESEVYSLSSSELTAEKINEIFRRCSEDFGCCDEAGTSFITMGWIDVNHFFEQPFYVISYPVSNDVSLQLYERELSQEGAGMELLLRMISEGPATLTDAVKSAGLGSPFDQGRMETVAQELQLWLDI